MFNCFSQKEFIANLIHHLNKLAKLTNKSEMMSNIDKEWNEAVYGNQEFMLTI